jgi:hypothetical protein
VLRKSLEKHGTYLDQVLYSILDEDWQASTDVRWRDVTLRVH